LNFTSDRAANLNLIYPLEANVFPGSMAFWVGQYKSPMAKATFNVRGVRDGSSIQMRGKPFRYLRRTWIIRSYRARGLRPEWTHCLRRSSAKGKNRATIDEIIRLSRKYKFVTPYTSFLAAPRALLRPRLIRPGDPVLRVHADESITSVVAMFPFGLVKKLRYLKEEDTWQTRFLAPTDLPDGTHQVRLLLRDKDGRVFPRIEDVRDCEQAAGGESQAGEDGVSTRRDRSCSRQRIGDFAHRDCEDVRCHSRESPMERCGRGQRRRSDYSRANWPAGRYGLTVTAEDFAHNIGSQEVWIEVLP